MASPERRPHVIAAPGRGAPVEPGAGRARRPRNPMPAFVRSALAQRGLLEAYRARPPYQQNDYLGWISRAKLEATRRKRLDQMLEELEGGELYMRMSWSPRGTREGA